MKESRRHNNEWQNLLLRLNVPEVNKTTERFNQFAF